LTFLALLLAWLVLSTDAMTAPRQVLPGTTYLVTRRCLQRGFLLRPSPLTNDIVGYLLAVAARRYDIQVHAYCVLSNHLHLVVTDPTARLPAFSQFFNSLVARAVNASLGRWETFWAPRSYSAVALATPEDIVAKAAYVLANPVAAGLVATARRWPGLWSSPTSIGAQPRTFERPRRFFRAVGRLPERAELELVAPPCFSDPAAFRDLLVTEYSGLEARARAEAAAGGRSFVGERRVMKTSPLGRPESHEVRRGPNPRVACRDKWKRIETLQRLVAFVDDYRRALVAWRDGQVGVVFPAGTYLVRLTHGVACAATG